MKTWSSPRAAVFCWKTMADSKTAFDSGAGKTPGSLEDTAEVHLGTRDCGAENQCLYYKWDHTEKTLFPDFVFYLQLWSSGEVRSGRETAGGDVRTGYWRRSNRSSWSLRRGIPENTDERSGLVTLLLLLEKYNSTRKQMLENKYDENIFISIMYVIMENNPFYHTIILRKCNTFVSYNLPCPA